MKRQQFIKTCGVSCLGLVIGTLSFESCSPTLYVQKTVENGKLRLALSEFQKEEGGEKFKRYLIVKPDSLDYPIVVYRLNKNKYQSLLLRCTHQGTELNVHGDLISCPAHGSEFSKTGQVIKQPAPSPLKSFISSVVGSELVISLS
jgi:Rieske Fe-S protein